MLPPFRLAATRGVRVARREYLKVNVQKNMVGFTIDKMEWLVVFILQLLLLINM